MEKKCENLSASVNHEKKSHTVSTFDPEIPRSRQKDWIGAVKNAVKILPLG